MVCSWFKAVILHFGHSTASNNVISRGILMWAPEHWPSTLKPRLPWKQLLIIPLKLVASLWLILFVNGHTCKYRMFTFTFLLWPSSMHTLSLHCNEKFWEKNTQIFPYLLKCEGHSSATVCSHLHFVFPLVNSYETTEGCIPTLLCKERTEMISLSCLKLLASPTDLKAS